MLSYILLFVLTIIVILGVLRASKQTQPGKLRRRQKEPFVGAAQAQAEVVDAVEMVGKPRIISRAPHKVPAPVFAEDVIDDAQEDIVAIRRAPQPAASHRPREETVLIDTPPLFASKPKPQPSTHQSDALKDVIVLNLVAHPEAPYRGYELLQALLAVGLRYGKWGIFHRHAELTGKGPTLFSLASSVEPGVFDLAKMGSFSTPGLTLFMRISSVENPLSVFEKVLAAAQHLTQELGGTVCDEKRIPLSVEKVAVWREQLPL